MSEGIDQYRKLAKPPPEALRPISGGRLTGMTNIDPQWRYEAMTEAFGLCGVGWKFEVVAKWTEPGPEGRVFAFADVNLYVKVNDEWSDPIPGTGGSKLVEKERNGLYANDEAFKMAITDALSTAMKMIGMAADVYAGLWDGSKYKQREADPGNAAAPGDGVTEAQWEALKKRWFKKHKDVADSMSKDDMRVAFGRWAHDTLGRKIDATDWQKWTPADLAKCQEALAVGGESP